MTKVTSGKLQHGLKMDDYYPDLANAGAWQHPDTAGPFDTGTWVGSNIQLYGRIPKTCRPSQFTLAQTITYDRFRVNGQKETHEGTSEDDIAASTRDASKPPFRQEGQDGAGYYISMADPPSFNYPSFNAIEYDRKFVTSLNGPGGSVSVNWSTSIRTANKRVTRNTIA